MGLPVTTFIVANNRNACLSRIFAEGVFSKEKIQETPSSAIDILVPLNFWRYLYFAIGRRPKLIKKYWNEFDKNGRVEFEDEVHEAFSEGYLSYSASDELTLDTIKELYEAEDYLLDPHGAVAVAALDALRNELGEGKSICLATAHPAKFPDVIGKVFASEDLPASSKHPSIEAAKHRCQKVYLCDHSQLEEALIDAMESNWALTKGMGT